MDHLLNTIILVPARGKTTFVPARCTAINEWGQLVTGKGDFDPSKCYARVPRSRGPKPLFQLIAAQKPNTTHRLCVVSPCLEKDVFLIMDPSSGKLLTIEETNYDHLEVAWQGKANTLKILQSSTEMRRHTYWVGRLRLRIPEGLREALLPN